MALFNAIQHTQITPHGWHIDLVHYVHKDGSDGSLSNHRPLALIDVLRKVFTGIVVDRMRQDWSRLKVLDECNPGCQAGRTTANAILPVRTAAEYCVATRTEMAVLLDDLKWCFDTPTGAPNATCENWPSFVRRQSVVTNLEALHLQIISPSGMSHLILCSARPHDHR